MLAFLLMLHNRPLIIHTLCNNIIIHAKIGDAQHRLYCAVFMRRAAKAVLNNVSFRACCAQVITFERLIV